MEHRCCFQLVSSGELVFLQPRLTCKALSALDMSHRALVWVVMKVNALMGDGVFEFELHYVRAYLAGKCVPVEVAKEGGIDRWALDPMVLHSSGLSLSVTNFRFWLLEAKEI